MTSIKTPFFEIGSYNTSIIPGITVIIPVFKRPELLKRTLDSLLSSEKYGEDFHMDITIVDGTPLDSEDQLKTIDILESYSSSNIHIRYFFETPYEGKTSIVNAKIEGFDLTRHETNSLLLFCDSDIALDKFAILRSLEILRTNPAAAWVSRRSIWDGKGSLNNTLWKPEKFVETSVASGKKLRRNAMGELINSNNELLTLGEPVYVSAIHGDWVFLYREAFELAGGFDRLFSDHGEHVDLSIRMWRSGFPLVYDSSVVVHHSIDAPASIMRNSSSSKSNRAPTILSTPLKMLYIYGTDSDYQMNKFGKLMYYKWLKNVFPKITKEEITNNLFVSLAKNLDYFMNHIADFHFSKSRANLQPFNVAPYEIFKDKSLFSEILESAPKRLEKMRSKAFNFKPAVIKVK